MSKGFFITGTDTGVGKTLVSTLLIQHFVAQGDRVVGMKPIASGAQLLDGELRNDDALALMAVANVSADYQQINPYCFAAPIAPHLAAQMTQTQISLTQIIDNYTALAQRADRIIVEGVGGWLVPINEQYYVADIALQLQLSVIMVVGMRLGCLNHALLTAESILAKGGNLIGWIANQIDATMPAYEENVQTLQTRLNLPRLTSIPYLPNSKIHPSDGVPWRF